MAERTEINIDDEIEHVSGILRDVETIELPWNEQELAGFDWEVAVYFVREMTNVEMNVEQRQKFEALKRRFKAANEKLKALGLDNPFEG